MVENNQDQLPEIGYLYHYPNLDHPEEKFRLDIFVTSEPTRLHFDVLRAHFMVEKEPDQSDKLSVKHPWIFEREAHVCPGLVVMEDKAGKKEEAFTFGGQLTIQSREFYTVCNLISTAPILELSQAAPLNQFLIEEIEILFAEQRAKFAARKEYDSRVCAVEPIRLYQASLISVMEKIDRLREVDERYRQLSVYLHQQVYRISAAGYWKEPGNTLEQLLTS
jgi:hypothetical protein